MAVLHGPRGRRRPYRGFARRAGLFRDRFPRTTELRGEVFELREAVLHRQDGRRVVDVDPGRERERGDRGRVDIDEVPRRVPRQEMAAAHCAPLPVALLRLVVLPDELLTFGHGDGLGLPQRERVDRAGGPAPAVGAMAVTGADGVTGHDELDRAAQALPLERLLGLTHDTPSSGRARTRYRFASAGTSPESRNASRIDPSTACRHDGRLPLPWIVNSRSV